VRSRASAGTRMDPQEAAIEKPSPCSLSAALAAARSGSAGSPGEQPDREQERNEGDGGSPNPRSRGKRGHATPIGHRPAWHETYTSATSPAACVLCDPPALELVDFVLSHLDEPPARVLEVGCGAGHLALGLASSGHDITAIDPVAPDGPIFERITLEEFAPTQHFDAVIAGRSLHHVADLDSALEKLAQLAPLLLLEEFAWDRFDEPTARWYLAHRQDRPTSVQECLRTWAGEHAGLHGYDALRAALDRRFHERSFAWSPYLYRYPRVHADARSEQEMVDAGAIRALGFRYVGARRNGPNEIP
jgi:SAM-dependent methyltransferase